MKYYMCELCGQVFGEWYNCLCNAVKGFCNGHAEEITKKEFMEIKRRELEDRIIKEDMKRGLK